MEFLRSFFRCHFAKKPVAAAQNVDCFVRLRNGKTTLALCVWKKTNRTMSRKILKFIICNPYLTERISLFNRKLCASLRMVNSMRGCWWSFLLWLCTVSRVLLSRLLVSHAMPCHIMSDFFSVTVRKESGKNNFYGRGNVTGCCKRSEKISSWKSNE